ncbi:MAG TPA: hypothetical protein VJK07_01275 [Candidatus Nanoarchaeia archaeon]|nr:hypothetical protein [Candidatus Nanoarchaeia archaeon]
MPLVRSVQQQFETRVVLSRDVRRGVIKCGASVSSVKIEGICLPVQMPYALGEPFFYGLVSRYAHLFNAPDLQDLRDKDGASIDKYRDRKAPNIAFETMSEKEDIESSLLSLSGVPPSQTEYYFVIPLDKIPFAGNRREIVEETIGTAREKLSQILGRIEQINLSFSERLGGPSIVALNHLEGFPQWMLEEAAKVGSYQASHLIVERIKRPGRQPKLISIPSGGMTD